MNVCEKKNIGLDKTQLFLKTLKFATILAHHSHQSSRGLKCVVTYIQEQVTSDLTHLACLYLCKFNLVVPKKMPEGSMLHGLRS